LSIQRGTSYCACPVYKMRHGFVVGGILVSLSNLHLSSCFVRTSFLQASSKESPERNDITIESYWEENSAKWEKTLRILDVRASWKSGSLNGILPSGNSSRGAPNDRLISLPRALELFEANEQTFPVRRRFRQMKLEEFRPRWDAVMSKRSIVRMKGQWEVAVDESEKYRTYEKSLVEGKVESADASPAYSRVVAKILSPALGAAARQRTRADGGVKATQVDLLESAGNTAEERWITAALLAELETELETIPMAQTVTQGSSFASQEAERDIEDAGSGALYGIITAALLFLAQKLWTDSI